jgi:anaerobic ribonucleoside-triphosphate reductase
MNDLTLPTEVTDAATQLEEAERTRCEVWTRVMGYHRPVTSFNKGKQSEHRERQFFVEGRCRHG